MSKFWYFDFMFNGKRYNKSTGKITKTEALEFESKFKAELEERYELCMTDGGRDIKLVNAVQLAIDKPTERPRAKKQDRRKIQIWGDFLSWLNENFPKVKLMNEVTRPMAEGYVTFLRTYGKHNKVIKQGKKRAFVANHLLSTKTLNSYQKEVQWVFDQLIADAGLSRNPFSHIKKLKNTKVKREAYTDAEMQLIEDNLADNAFCKHIYYVGIGTGMRMGNICLLEWEDIDLEKMVIRCENLKTGGKLTIPILDGLYEYLVTCEPKLSGYVSEAHATRYKNNLSDVSVDFIKFLNSIGIETQKVVKGRSRACNIKGIHALRHTFIYRAMIAKIPINIIQCIVGHVDEEITRMYADHVIVEDARAAMSGFSLLKSNTPETGEVRALSEKLSTMPPEKVNQLLAFLSV